MALLLVLLLASARDAAWATCNVIPGTTQAFRASRGTLDRPFARPGDWLALNLEDRCQASAPDFPQASDVVVSVVFQPPGNAPRHIVSLATDCARVAVCPGVPGGCRTVNKPGQSLSLTVGRRRVSFRFPDTDDLLVEPDDDLTLSGPAAVAVTRVGEALPCGLAASSCREQSGLLACADRLLAADGTCSDTPHDTFTQFTALPPPNDYQALCKPPSSPSTSICSGALDELRIAVDAAGNLLIPMDWRGVLVGDAVPIARLLRGSSELEAFEGGGAPITIPDIPDLTVLGAYSPEGSKLPPVFDPQVDPTLPSKTTLFGTTDAPEGVLRVARRPPPPAAQCETTGQICRTSADCDGGACRAPTCRNGPNAGGACTNDEQCDGGECGPELFEFRTRLVQGIGPLLLRRGACLGGVTPLAPCTTDAECDGGQCGRFDAEAGDPVPLDGLNQSAELNAFVLEETLADTDLNEDDDTDDHVVMLQQRATGKSFEIGVGESEGRAVLRINDGRFTPPALAVAGEIAAFLEPEPAQENRDANGDGDRVDTILRVFRDGTELTDPMAPRAVDAAPLLDRRNVVISEGNVFFRTPDTASDTFTREPLSATHLGTAVGLTFPTISGDGRFVAAQGDLETLPEEPPFDQVFLLDRSTDQLRLASHEPGTEVPGNAPSRGPIISRDGGTIVFDSEASNLVPNDTNTRVCFEFGGIL